MDPQYNEIDTNSLESVGKGKTMKKTGKKLKGSNINYPQKKVTGMERTGMAKTTPKRVTKRSGAKKYMNVKK